MVQWKGNQILGGIDMICYHTALESYQKDEGGSYLSFSLTASENGRDLKKIEDVSLDRQTVERLLAILNGEHVPLMHFYDVVVAHL